MASHSAYLATNRPENLNCSTRPLQIVSGGTFVTDDSGALVDGSAAFSGGGELSMTGPSTSFTSNSLSFTGTGVYAPALTGATHGLISVTGTLDLAGGTLRPSFDSFTPTGSESWTLADAVSINGQFTVDPSQANLPLGTRFRTSNVPGGTNGQQLVLDFDALLVLTVNADDGSASLSSPSGDSIDIIGYGIASAAGKLSPGGWSSLADQSVPGWSEAGTPTANNLDELAGPIGPGMLGSATITATPTSIGSPFVVPQAFQETFTDLTYEYVTDSGEVIQGQVDYTGLNAVNNLLLTVDPSTGQAELKNSSLTTLQLRGYSILSDSGALKPANGDWNSLEDQGTTGVEEANPTANSLSELVPLAANAVTLTPGLAFDLGNLFDTAGMQDLTLEFLITESSAPIADYNNNGVTDAADYTVWRDNLGTTNTLPNDPIGGTIGQAHYDQWKTNFNATGGAGGFAILDGVVLYDTLVPGLAAAATVPEPGTTCLIAVMLASAAAFGRRDRRAAFPRDA